jgi:hypothetical protein
MRIVAMAIAMSGDWFLDLVGPCVKVRLWVLTVNLRYG